MPSRPSLVIRKHLFSLSLLDELRERGMVERGIQSLLAAAVRARKNIIVTSSGNPTLVLGRQ